LRQVVTFLAVGCAGLLVLCLATFGYFGWRGLGLDQTGNAYAQTAITAITTHWDWRELRSRATDDLNHRISEQKLSSLFVWYSSLGRRVAEKGCRGNSITIYKSFPGDTGTITGRYVCEETFQEGDATVSITLIRQNGTWRITGFRVNSDALGAEPPTERI